MKIELLSFEDSPNHDAAVDLLSSVLAEHLVSEPIDYVDVPDAETGERVRFPGSPTIRINGNDIDPNYEDSGDYALQCRVYATPDGYSGVPDRAWIESAIADAV